ncbi:MAG TPA: surface-adhesin E family protein [Sulfuricella sp.]|nr:surface-adhesin E family protein [Sulfuricella sp.]
MRHASLLLLLAFLSTMPSAHAAEWAAIQGTSDGDQFFYDKSKLFINDDEITYWKKVVFLTPRPFKDKLTASALYRERINCAEHTLKLVSYLLYAPSGEPAEYVATATGEATPIIPDSLGDVFEKSLCPLVWKHQEEKRLKDEAEKRKEEEEKLKAEQQTLQKLEEKRLKAEAESEKAPLPASPPPAAVQPPALSASPTQPTIKK